jgi:hypothetical protein
LGRQPAKHEEKIMTRLVMVAVTTALLLGLSTMAQARSGYKRLPALGGKGRTLRIKIVGYKGGKMHVQVRNVGKRAATFKANGLYFVPAGKPEQAPQRMGAAGPMEVSEAGTWKRKQAHRVGAKKTVTIRLDVFCLDSHRSSPSNGQRFSVARKRLPKRLRQRIVEGSNRIYRKARRYKRPSRGAIQGYIWKTRNKRWIKLQGERQVEKSRRVRRPRRRYRRQRQRQRLRRRYKRLLRR